MLQPDINTRGHTQWWVGVGRGAHIAQAPCLQTAAACSPAAHKVQPPLQQTSNIHCHTCTNTRTHTCTHACRYYFAVSNTRAGQAYRFNIINLLKDDSLYCRGMLPLVHSEWRLAEEVSAFWGVA